MNLSHSIAAKVTVGTLAASAFSALGFAGAADAQTRVHTSMHTSSGSCASCDLSNKSMTRMRLLDADFSNSNFYRSNLSGGRLHGSNLSGATFSKAFLVNVQGERVDMSGAVLTDATLTDARLTNSHFPEADLRRADLSRGDFSGSDFSGADLASANARGANLSGAVLREARLPMANLDSANLDGADLAGAAAGDVSFKDATLVDANLSGADLRNARGLTQAQLDTACGDADTRLPRSLAVSYCDPTTIAAFERAAIHGDHDHSQVALRLDTAIADVETLIAGDGLQGSDRRRLERIHSQLVGSRRALGE